MKCLLMCFAIVAWAGCGTPTHVGQTAAAPETSGQVPGKVVEELPSRLRFLEPGMTEDQVFRALGLYDYRLSGDADGPMQMNRRSYVLRRDCNLVLVFDARRIPAEYLSAELNGAGWRAGRY